MNKQDRKLIAKLNKPVLSKEDKAKLIIEETVTVIVVVVTVFGIIMTFLF